MLRRIRLLVLLLLVVPAAGAVALAVTQRPDLDAERQAVDARWTPLRAPLATRYDTLSTALAAFDTAAGGARGVTTDLRQALAAWEHAARNDDAAAEAAAAVELEGQATRLAANARGSDRFRDVKPLTAALTAFGDTAPAPALVDAYNSAVRRYEDRRRGVLERPVAAAFGFGPRPLLSIPR